MRRQRIEKDNELKMIVVVIVVIGWVVVMVGQVKRREG